MGSLNYRLNVKHFLYHYLWNHLNIQCIVVPRFTIITTQKPSQLFTKLWEKSFNIFQCHNLFTSFFNFGIVSSTTSAAIPNKYYGILILIYQPTILKHCKPSSSLHESLSVSWCSDPFSAPNRIAHFWHYSPSFFTYILI